MKNAEIPVIANVTASPINDSQEIEEKLIQQLYSPCIVGRLHRKDD